MRLGQCLFGETGASALIRLLHPSGIAGCYNGCSYQYTLLYMLELVA